MSVLNWHHLPAAAKRHLIIALTNNFSKTDTDSIPASEAAFLGWGEDGPTPPHLRALFDDFCDSSTLGMRYADFVVFQSSSLCADAVFIGKRKPEPEIFLLACKRNNIRPEEAVFLDDLRV